METTILWVSVVYSCIYLSLFGSLGQSRAVLSLVLVFGLKEAQVTLRQVGLQLGVILIAVGHANHEQINVVEKSQYSNSSPVYRKQSRYSHIPEYQVILYTRYDVGVLKYDILCDGWVTM